MAKSPKQPKKKESRAHPRFEIFASVELRHGAETLVLPARNVSLGGLYLDADGKDLSGIEPGEFVEIMLFEAEEEARPAVRADARVLRHQGNGIALTWASTDPVVARKLASLLERLNPS